LISDLDLLLNIPTSISIHSGGIEKNFKTPYCMLCGAS